MAVATQAHATPRAARLIYSRTPDADSCPNEAVLKQAVMSRVGYDPFFPWAATTVVARFSKDSAGATFVASVELIDEQGFDHGVRELKAPTCDALLSATALVISIAVDPQSLTRPTSPPPEPEAPAPFDASTTPPPSSAAPAPPRANAARAPRPSEPVTKTKEAGFEVMAGVSGSGGHAPALAVGGVLGVGLRWASVSVVLEGRVDAPASVSAEGGGRVQSWLALGALVPCAHLGPAFICAVAQIGSLQAESTGVSSPRSSSSLWLGAGGRLGVDLVVSSLFVARLHMDLVGNLAPTTLRVNCFDAWVTPPVNGSAGVEWVVRFM